MGRTSVSPPSRSSIRRFFHPLRTAVSLLLGLALFLCSSAFSTSAASLGLTIYRVDVSAFPVIHVYATLLGSGGDPVVGLDPDTLSLQEDHQKVAGLQVEQVVDQTVPADAEIVVDTSGSMNDTGKLAIAKAAAQQYLTTMRAGDQTAITAFAVQSRVVQGLTSDSAKLQGAISGLSANGNTAIYDAVVAAAKDVASAPAPSGTPPRRLVVLLTDGMDNSSKVSLDQAAAELRDLGIPVVALGLGSDARMDVLQSLAEASGGQAVLLPNGNALGNVVLPLFRSTQDGVRRAYRLTYTTPLAPDGQSHTLELSGTYAGQQVQSTASLAAPSPPPTLQVTGLADRSTVFGSQTIHVALSNGAPWLATLMVDGQARGPEQRLPADFTWDASAEGLGAHRVTITATPPSGTAPVPPPVQQTFVVQVVAPTATPAPVPTPNPTSVPPTAIPTRTPAPPASAGIPAFWSGVLAVVVSLALLALVVGLGALALYVVAQIRRVPPTPERNDEVDVQVEDPDATEIIRPLRPVPAVRSAPGAATPPPSPAPVGASPASVPDEDGPTIVPASPSPAPALARLRIVEAGGRREIYLARPETILGREQDQVVVIPDIRGSSQARIVVQGNEYWIETLRNGDSTRVNGEVITRRRLSRDDRIQIGDALMTFTVEPN